MSVCLQIENLKKSSIRDVVDSKIQEFKSVRGKGDFAIFSELCFCIMAANFTAERSFKIQKEIGEGFVSLSPENLALRLKALGHRFPNTRARYISEARKYLYSLNGVISDLSSDEEGLRMWLSDNIKGLGLKESSHFLRNIGFENFAIVDFHIADFLSDNGLIVKPKTITKRAYLDIESVLRSIGKKVGLNMAELDLYLWYLETGKILK